MVWPFLSMAPATRTSLPQVHLTASTSSTLPFECGQQVPCRTYRYSELLQPGSSSLPTSRFTRCVSHPMASYCSQSTRVAAACLSTSGGVRCCIISRSRAPWPPRCSAQMGASSPALWAASCRSTSVQILPQCLARIPIIKDKQQRGLSRPMHS